MPNRVLLRSLLLLLAAVAATVQACDASEPCDPNQRFEGSVCANVPSSAGAGGTRGSTSDVDAGGAAAVDAGPDAGTDAATGCTQALQDALGVTCSAPTECGCAAPYCAVTPGQTEGYCTTQDCDPAVGDCPNGYTCFDLASVGVSGFPTFCVKQ